MLRFGLIGTGFWAATVHAAGIAAHPEVELVGVWGRDPAKCVTLAAQYGAQPFSDKDLARMRNFEDVPDAQVAALRAPMLILLGDRDVVRPEHGFELTKLIPGSRLLILPGGHGDYLGEADATPEGSPWPAMTAGLIEAFLDAP